jgi:hypothetical protein
MQIKSPSYLNKPFPTYSGPVTPPYEANEPLPEYGALTPSGSVSPSGDNQSKAPVQQTGGSNQDSARQYASLFAGVWNNYSTNKK